MFAAALMFSCAGCEVSIYSTCKRISTKLLRNVTMFLGIIYDVLKCERIKIISANQEEVHLQGDEGYQDVRIIQSYPSKVVEVSLFKCCSLFLDSFFVSTAKNKTGTTHVSVHVCMLCLCVIRRFMYAPEAA